MRLISTEERDKLLASAAQELMHLELRDVYGLASEAPQFARFLATGQRDHVAEAPGRQRWNDLIRGLRARGCQVRRARIVSEPATDYIRYEYAGTGPIVAAGEEVRWLPRRLASALALPGNDFWLVDDTAVIFTVFTGDGAVAERQLVSDAATLQLCRSAFEAVWPIAIPHDQYRPR